MGGKHKIFVIGGHQGDFEVYCSCGERIAMSFLPKSWKKLRRLIRAHKKEQ